MLKVDLYKEYVSKYLYLLGSNKRKFPLLLFLFIISSIFDMLGIGLIGPFIKIATDPNVIQKYKSAEYLMNLFNMGSYQNFVITIGILIAFVFYLKSIMGYYIQKRITSFSFNNKSDLINRLMQTYQDLDYAFHVKRNSASLVQRLLENTNLYTEMTLMSSLRFLSESIVIVCIILLLAMTNLMVTISLAASLLFLMLIYDKLVKKRFHTSGSRLVDSSEDILKWFNQAIYGFKEIRVLGAENYFYDKVNSSGKVYADAASIAQALQSIPRYLVESALLTIVVGMVIVALSTGGDITDLVPALGVFAIASFRLIPSVNKVATSFTNMRFSKQAMDNLYEDLILIHDIAYTSKQKMKYLSEKSSANNASEITADFKSIKMVDVCFKYTDSSESVLNNINLVINKGDCVGIVGKSGSGKTTLIDILLGLYLPSSGDIQIDQVSMLDSIESWVKIIAYIPQNFFLLDDTIKNNITLGQSSNAINDRKLKLAIIDVQLEDFIEDLPNKLETIIGEHGVKLSGGQRQRIALARAFYHDREIIVMDEATSSLDVETEDQIIDVINKMKRYKTLIVIAHKESTLRPCDYIYRLNNGCIQLTTEADMKVRTS